MPDFRIEPVGLTLQAVPWSDPDSSTRAGRITTSGSLQRRRYKINPYETVRLNAILMVHYTVHADVDVGLFTAWCLEAPLLAGKPMMRHPIVGMSAVVEFTLGLPGHYTFAMRHENDGSGAFYANAGGAVLIHIDAVAP